MSNEKKRQVLLEDDWQRRLENAQECAQSGKEGDVFFLQAGKTPLVSCFITTGKWIAPLNEKRNVDIRFVSQHMGYPPLLGGNNDIDMYGYDSFKKALQLNKGSVLSQKFEGMDIEKYKIWFEETCVMIDTCIVENHGVKCFTDNDVSNNDKRNCFFLHVCDIMNIIIARDSGDIPVVIVKSELLKTLASNVICNELEHRYLKPHNWEFMKVHIDFFYKCYGYYGNHSFIPIRTKIEKDSQAFVSASFFTNDAHFVEHQAGKMKEINQNERSVVSRVMYRSI